MKYRNIIEKLTLEQKCALLSHSGSGKSDLLKNEEGLIPLVPGTKVAVIGDFAKHSAIGISEHINGNRRVENTSSV